MRENPVRARNHSSPWNLTWWRLARVEDESKSMLRLLHPTNNKEKHTSRGQYKAQVLSRYHRPTQNRKQYISNNNVKPTKYLTGDNNKYHNHWPQHQAHLWGLKPPYHTHLGDRFFEFNYIYIIPYSTPLFLLCRNVTLRSPNTTCRFVTPDPLILRVGSWHPIP